MSSCDRLAEVLATAYQDYRQDKARYDERKRIYESSYSCVMGVCNPFPDLPPTFPILPGIQCNDCTQIVDRLAAQGSINVDAKMYCGTPEPTPEQPSVNTDEPSDTTPNETYIMIFLIFIIIAVAIAAIWYFQKNNSPASQLTDIKV